MNFLTLTNTANTKKSCLLYSFSCSVVEEINVLSDIVNDFEKNSTEYSELRRKKEHLEKVLKQIDTKINGKKRKLLLIKDTIQEKDRNISSRIASLTISQKIPADNKLVYIAIITCDFCIYTIICVFFLFHFCLQIGQSRYGTDQLQI